MLSVCEKDQCTGCMACADICPKGAIKINDSMSALNAIIDETKCIHCDACHRICQNNNPPELREPICWKQGWSNDADGRANSSSGGIAGEIERQFIFDGGIVYSCIFEHGKFVFRSADTVQDIDRFIGSKYVKSNPKGVYSSVSSDLKKGKRVLFVGLPCQCAALKKFIGDNNRLWTVDLICHGTPSPHILECYLDSYKLELANIKRLEFRRKNRFHLFRDCNPVGPLRIMDDYTYTFLNAVSYTENCYNCTYAQSKRVSDITLGDSWGSLLSENERKKGISLILCQTEKGKELVEKANTSLFDVDIERAIEYNHQLIHPSIRNVNRIKFFESLYRTNNFRKTVRLVFPKVFYKNTIKAFLIKTRVLSKE